MATIAQNLVADLKGKDYTEQLFAARGLRKIVWDDKKPQGVVDADAIPVLVKLLSHTKEKERELLEDVAKCLRSILSYNEDYQRAVAKEGGILALANLLKLKDAPIVWEHAAHSLASLAKFVPELRREIWKKGCVELLVDFVKQADRQSGLYVSRCLQALYFLSHDPRILEVLEAHDLPATLTRRTDWGPCAPYLSMLLSNLCRTEVNRQALLSPSSVIQALISLMRDRLGGMPVIFPCYDTLDGLKRLAVHDCNKALIGDRLFIKLLIINICSKPLGTARDGIRTHAAAVECLQQLFFDKTVKTSVKEEFQSSLEQTMEQLASQLKTFQETGLRASHADQVAAQHNERLGEAGMRAEQEACTVLGKAIEGVLWQLREHEEEKAQIQAEQKKQHIMLSYNWSAQTQVKQVQRALQEQGYVVWMDVDQMGGSTLVAMADAVERAGVMLMFVSKDYKQSANCRTEAEYAFKLQRRIVPVLVEPDGYTGDGWLGMIVGSKLYFDISHSAAEGNSNNKKGTSSFFSFLKGGDGDQGHGQQEEDAYVLPASKMKEICKELGDECKQQPFPSKQKLSTASSSFAVDPVSTKETTDKVRYGNRQEQNQKQAVHSECVECQGGRRQLVDHPSLLHAATFAPIAAALLGERDHRQSVARASSVGGSTNCCLLLLRSSQCRPRVPYLASHVPIA